MTANERRQAIVTAALTREKKNQYSQAANKRTKIESGYGDCSGTVWYWYNKKEKVDIGGNTEAQINSKVLKDVNVTITNGIPNESQMRPGDLLFFRGSDNSRTKGVGHVEMYIGNGKCFGHGSGIGGTVKNLVSYCKMRQSLSSTAKLKNKGLICVRRYIWDDIVKEEDLPMTEQEKKDFNELKTSVKNLNDNVSKLITALENSKEKVYHSMDELPASWAQPVIKRLKEMGVSVGSSEDLNLPESMLRSIILAERIVLAYKEKVYHYTNELPADWARPVIQRLMDNGIYSGASESDLNLSETLLRCLVLMDRIEKFKEKNSK